VTVRASLTGLERSVVTAVTDRAGNAVLRSANLLSRERGTVTFAVRDVTFPGYTYLPALNKLSTSTVRR
jgi:hypothetical protein